MRGLLFCCSVALVSAFTGPGLATMARVNTKVVMNEAAAKAAWLRKNSEEPRWIGQSGAKKPSASEVTMDGFTNGFTSDAAWAAAASNPPTWAGTGVRGIVKSTGGFHTGGNNKAATFETAGDHLVY